MKSEMLARSPLLALPLIALFIFLTVFGVMLVITLTKRAHAYDPLARLPLDETDDDAGGER